MTDFSSLNLRPELMRAIADRGYTTETPIQSAIIPVMLEGHDVIGQAQTGTGKTAAFALPILQRLGGRKPFIQSLIMAPTRELALQVAGAFGEYGKHMNVRVLAVYGGQPYGPQITKLSLGVDVVVGTPGRLLDLIKRNAIDLAGVRTVVLDEADEMLSMGFIEDMEAILARTPRERQTALFSATLPPAIRALAGKYMNEPRTVAIKRERVTLDTIAQRYYMMHERDKLAALTRLLEFEDMTSVIIFARTRQDTGELANALVARGVAAEALSGELDQKARERVLGRFRQGILKVLVATDVAARGLDIDNISHIVNVDLPDDPEVFVHRIGRTGRAGKTGVAICLVAPHDIRRLRIIEGFTRQRMQRMAMPGVEDILRRRDERLVQRVLDILKDGAPQRERDMAAELAGEGKNPLDVAAAALKLAQGAEQDRPILPIHEVAEPRSPRPDQDRGRGGPPPRGQREYGPRPERGKFIPGRGRRDDAGSRDAGGPPRGRAGAPAGRPAPRGRQAQSHEEGMVRLVINRGASNGVRVNDVVSTIAHFSGIPGHVLGRIDIQDRYTYVDVPERFADTVLTNAGQVRIRQHLARIAPA